MTDESQSIETAPKDKWLLLWWRPRSDPRYPHPPENASAISNNRYAETWVVGMIRSDEPGSWWNGQRGEYQDIWHVTRWMPLPAPPNGEMG
jgi:hypothetical protein